MRKFNGFELEIDSLWCFRVPSDGENKVSVNCLRINWTKSIMGKHLGDNSIRNVGRDFLVRVK